MLKRIILTVLFLVALNFSAVRLAYAAVDDATNPNGYQPTAEDIAAYTAAVQNCDTPSLECLVRHVYRFIFIEMTNDINGGPMTLSSPKATGRPTTSLPTTIQTGAVANAFRMVGALYSHPPAHTATYVADVVRSSGLATPAYAQGLGFASLDPILNLWKIFRNVAYFFFIVILIVLGFMIMLRQKISGQAAVTAQQAIPSVVISLILVTFSYAIAGFMVDLMYVLMYLIIGLFSGITVNGLDSSGRTASDLITFNILDLIGFFFRDTLSQAGNNWTLVSDIFSAAGANTATAGIGGFLGGLTLTVVITIAVLIGTIRLFFEMLKSYAAIILYTVASPLILMFGAIPGKNVFGSWLKGIIGNLLVFPAVLLMIILYVEFSQGSHSGGANAGFLPPFLFGNGTVSNMVGPLLGLAIILGLPDIIKEIKKATGAGDGGLGSMLAGFAWSGLQRGWKGDKSMGFIPGASAIPGIAGRAALTGTGATIGGIVGGRAGGWKGALLGGSVGGFVGNNATNITKGVFGTAKRQVYDVIGSEAATAVTDRVERATTLVKEQAQQLGVFRSKDALESNKTAQGKVINETSQSGRKIPRNRV